MRTKLIEGVYAALLTPRSGDGRLDESAFLHLLHFLLENDITGFVLNGATGEFCLTTPAELERLTTLTAKAIGPGLQYVCGVGSTSVEVSCQLADIAARNGAAAVLLPPPHFFPYQQEDVAAFLSTVAGGTQLPVLLYNLPLFTSPIETETAVRLLLENPNIVGIKDSSGSLDILKAVTNRDPAACRIVGSDGALIQALGNRCCDAVISGVACVLPELITRIYKKAGACRRDCEKLNEFLETLAPFPTPWGLKWIAEARALVPAHFSQALSARRLEQGRKLQQWFKRWSGEN